MRIGILTAMQEELQDLKAAMTGVEQVQVGNKTIYCGQLFRSDVILSLSGVGKVNAALSVGLLKAKYDVDIIIMTGLAGSASTGIHVGDIVVSSAFIQHDVDSRPNFPRFVVPFTSQAILAIDTRLNDMAVNASKSLAQHITDKIKLEVLKEFAITSPVIHSGLIGTGDKFIADTQILDELTQAIKKEFKSDLLCVEMEGAAVAQSCQELNIPCVVIRIISDCPYLQESVKNYHRFKQLIAAPYCHVVLENLLPSLAKYFHNL